jgi:magnesium-transporting ATPase (P-type)
VNDLQAQGIRAVMLSGDKPAAAHEVAAALGIAPNDVYAGVKPAGATHTCTCIEGRGTVDGSTDGSYRGCRSLSIGSCSRDKSCVCSQDAPSP